MFQNVDKILLKNYENIKFIQNLNKKSNSYTYTNTLKSHLFKYESYYIYSYTCTNRFNFSKMLLDTGSEFSG